MTIRFRLLILVVILATVSLTTLGYLVAAFYDTRESLAEADAALVEFRCAVDAGAGVGRVRLSLFHYLATGAEAERNHLVRHIGDCTDAFDAWIASSRGSLEAGIEAEADDFDTITGLYREYREQLDRLRAQMPLDGPLLGPGKDAIPPEAITPIFEELVEGEIRVVTENDILELGGALDGVLLSMGTTPWIAKIGPAQLASARATLSELQSAHEVRSQLLRLSSDLAAFVAGGDSGEEQAIGNSAAALEVALDRWGASTKSYSKVSGREAPSYCAEFTLQIPPFLDHVREAQILVRAGKIEDAHGMVGREINQALEEQMLRLVDTSLEVEMKELREMLGHLSASTGAAGVSGIALVCALLVCALLLFLSTARRMIRALDRLRADTEIIGGGDFAYRIELNSNDELGLLAANFDAMAEKLQQQVLRQKALEGELLRNERLATLGQVIATVSHEIRNPLGTIQTALYSLRIRLGDQGDAVSRPLDRAERSIVRCDRIIGELLDYIRTREPVRVETSLDSWLAEVLDDFNFPAGVAVLPRLDSGVILRIDRNRIQGCVVNLLSNACQSIVERPGGPEYCALYIASRCREGRVEIEIADTGPGIEPEVLSKIFEPMFSTRTFGVGLGLPIVKKNMEQHGGGVEIASEVGRGTTVALWFPAPNSEETQDEDTSNTGG